MADIQAGSLAGQERHFAWKVLDSPLIELSTMANPSPSRRPLPGSPLAAQQAGEAVPDKDSVVASFSSIKWDDFGRTLIDASEVREAINSLAKEVSASEEG